MASPTNRLSFVEQALAQQLNQRKVQEESAQVPPKPSRSFVEDALQAVQATPTPSPEQQPMQATRPRSFTEQVVDQTAATPVEEKSFVESAVDAAWGFIPSPRDLAAMGVRIAGPLIGGATGLPLAPVTGGVAPFAGGAAGAALVEPIAQMIEGRKEINMMEAVVAAIFGGIPLVGGPAKTVIGGVAKRGVNTAIYGVAEETGRSVVRGEGIPATSTLVTATGVGLILGGGFGGIETKLAQRPLPQPAPVPKPNAVDEPPVVVPLRETFTVPFDESVEANAVPAAAPISLEQQPLYLQPLDMGPQPPLPSEVSPYVPAFDVPEDVPMPTGPRDFKSRLVELEKLASRSGNRDALLIADDADAAMREGDQVKAGKLIDKLERQLNPQVATAQPPAPPPLSVAVDELPPSFVPPPTQLSPEMEKLAHDINNPLGNIHGVSQLLESNVHPDAPVAVAARKIVDDIDVLSERVRANPTEYTRPGVWDRLEQQVQLLVDGVQDQPEVEHLVTVIKTEFDRLKAFTKGQPEVPPRANAIAFRKKDGTIVVDPDANFHIDAIERSGVDPDDVLDTGFVTAGEYTTGKNKLPTWVREEAVAQGMDLREGTAVGARVPEPPPPPLPPASFGETGPVPEPPSPPPKVKALRKAKKKEVAAAEAGGEQVAAMKEPPPPVVPPKDLPGGPGGLTPEEADFSITELRLKTPVVQTIVDAVRANPEYLLGDGRAYMRIANAMEAAGVDPQVVRWWKDSFSGGGAQLGTLGRLMSQITKEVAKDNPELARILRSAGMVDTVWTRAALASGRVINFWRGSIVGQLATGMRILAFNAPRYSLSIFDEAVQAKFGGGTPGLAREMAHEAMAILKRTRKLGDVKKFLEEAAPMPKDLTDTKALARFGSTRMLLNLTPAEVPLLNRYTKFINTFNEYGDQFFRRAAFDAYWRAAARAKGLDIGEILKTPGLLPTDILRDGTRFALELTMSAPPEGHIGRAVMQVYDAFPPVALVQPFPRMYMNALKFMYDFSPASMLDFAFVQKGKLKETAAMLDDPKLSTKAQEKVKAEYDRQYSSIVKQLSRAAFGTAFFAGAVAMRSSQFAGPKYYQLTDGEGNIYDLKAYNPMTWYLFWADATRSIAEMGVDMVRDGKDLQEIMKKRYNLNARDLYEGITGLGRSSVGAPLLDAVFKADTMEKKWDLFRNSIANFLGGFSVPFKTITDFSQGLGIEEAIRRDTRELWLGPFMQNIPGLGRQLPEARSIVAPLSTQEVVPGTGIAVSGPLRNEHPLIRQFAGLTMSSRLPIERELNKLGIQTYELEERTGQAELDREINKVAGGIVGYAAPIIMSSPGYQALSDPFKRFYWANIFNEARSAGRAAAMRNPDFMEMNLEEVFQNRDAAERALLREADTDEAVAIRGELRKLGLSTIP